MVSIICFIDLGGEKMIINKRQILFLLYFVSFELIAIANGLISSSIYGTDFRTLCIYLWMTIAVIFYGFRIPKKFDRIEKFIFSFLAVVCIEIIVSKFSYGQSWMSSLKMGYFYLVFLVYLILDRMICSVSDYIKFRKALLGFVVCFAFLGLIIPSYRFLFYELLISLPLFFEMFFNKKNWKNLLLLALIIVYMVITGDNLSKRLAIAACLAVEALIHINNNTSDNDKRLINKRKIQKILIALVLFCVFLYMPITSFINQMINADAGLLVRVEAYSYYFNQFLTKPLLGMGLIDPNASITNYYLVAGIRANGLSQYYLDDIGILGFINQFGLVGICLLIYLIRTMFQFIFEDKNQIIIENLMLFIVYCIMNIALLPTNKTVLPMFVIMLILMKKNRQFSKEMRMNK